VERRGCSHEEHRRIDPRDNVRDFALGTFVFSLIREPTALGAERGSGAATKFYQSMEFTRRANSAKLGKRVMRPLRRAAIDTDYPASSPTTIGESGLRFPSRQRQKSYTYTIARVSTAQYFQSSSEARCRALESPCSERR